jgi:hypothetical protein
MEVHSDLSAVPQKLGVDIVQCEWKIEVEIRCSWTTCESYIQAHLLWALVQHFPKKCYGIPLQWVCFAKNMVLFSQCPTIHVHTLIGNQCWCHNCRIAWGISPANKWVYISYNGVSCKSCNIGEHSVRIYGLVAHLLRSHQMNSAIPG